MARVSSQPQAKRYSLSLQEQHCRTYAAERGWEVVQVFSGVESAFTDDLRKRPLLRRVLLGAVRREYTAILVLYSDRWMRSVVLAGRCSRILDRVGARVVVVDNHLENEFFETMERTFLREGWTPPDGWEQRREQILEGDW